MKLTTSIIAVCWAITSAVAWPRVEPVSARPSENIPHSTHFARCFKGTELSDSLAALKLQGGPEVAKVYASLLAKARTSPVCRAQVVQAVMSGMEHASKNVTNPYDNFFFFKHGAALLAELKATEALDLLLANIDLNDEHPSSLDDFPALVAILKIGKPALPKLQTLLTNDTNPGRRKFAVLAIAYIGGSEARRALASALSRETDPCNKKFLEISLQAFDNKARPNHVSSELNGKWLSAFHCL